MRRADRLFVDKGRGAVTNPAGRFDSTSLAPADDGWGSLDVPPGSPATQLIAEFPRHAITTNRSPDVPFDQSLNPYQGCEHGCIYCFARPAHAYLNLSPGLDFETRIFHKPKLAALLQQELAHPRYQCRVLHIGGNTDPYQPAERELRSTRAVLELLLERRHPLSIITKGALILRDIDLLRELAALQLVSVHVSITSLDDALKRTLEPRAASPQARLRVVRELAAAGVPVGVMMAPVIPALNDHEIERLLAAVATAGAQSASFMLLRLPLRGCRIVRGLVATALSGSRRARPEPPARDARWPAQRSPLRAPDAGPGRLCRAAFGALRRGVPTSRTRYRAGAPPRHDPVPARPGPARAARPVRRNMTGAMTGAAAVRLRWLVVYSDAPSLAAAATGALAAPGGPPWITQAQHAAPRRPASRTAVPWREPACSRCSSAAA